MTPENDIPVQTEPGELEPEVDDAVPEAEAVAPQSANDDDAYDAPPGTPVWNKANYERKRAKQLLERLTPEGQKKAIALQLHTDARPLIVTAKWQTAEGQIYRLERWAAEERGDHFKGSDPESAKLWLFKPPAVKPSAAEPAKPKKNRRAERAAAEAAKPSVARRTLAIGSDVEIAQRVAEDLQVQFGEIVFDEGDFYCYRETCWRALSEEEKRKAVHLYDGATYFTPEFSEQAVRLSKSRIDSVLNEMRAKLWRRDFFADAPVGINCASGFITFDFAGQPSQVEHGRAHGCRHTLPGRWYPRASAEPPRGSMLHRLINGVFEGDKDADQKRNLIAEAAGCAALGYATKLRRPKALVFYGPTAENGKSQILDAIRGLLPKSAISSVPVTKFSDETFLVRIPGKLLNASDELKGSAAIASDTFKACVTGETVTARDLYRSAIEFRPIALHVFATNKLPGFEGGFDRGVLRRLLMLSFNRFIPNEERIENIGQRIVQEEADILLAFAVGGATRLIKQRDFTVPSSSDAGLQKWASGSDPVLAWVVARVDPADAPQLSEKVIGIKSSYAHSLFKGWALGAGYRLDSIPAINGFVQRLESNKTIAGINVKHTRTGNWLTGLKILGADRDPKEDGIEDAGQVW